MRLLLAALSVAPFLDDRPPLDDLDRLPSLCAAEEQLRANRLYREYLECRIVVEHHQQWTIYAALVETDRLYAAWDALRWARLYGATENRRDMLNHLRDLLGPDAYYAGHMPPPVPLHRLVTKP